MCYFILVVKNWMYCFSGALIIRKESYYVCVVVYWVKFYAKINCIIVFSNLGKRSIFCTV